MEETATVGTSRSLCSRGHKDTLRECFKGIRPPTPPTEPAHNSLGGDQTLQEKMIGFYKPKTYRSTRGCCICKAKSSSSRFTDSMRYEGEFQSCFGIHESRTGDICNACVLLVKRWKKLPKGSKKNWNHVVDARGGPNLKAMRIRPKKLRPFGSQRLQGDRVVELKEKISSHYSEAHSTTSSVSPTHSSSCSNHSDTDTDTELRPAPSRNSHFSFLDPTYWKRQKVCCGIIYEGRFGEILIDAQLFKPCCSNRKTEIQRPEALEPQIHRPT